MKRKQYIAILEDDEPRRRHMEVILVKYFKRFRHIYFADATAFICWLKENLSCTVLMSLDHDLGNEAIDSGSGIDVVDYLCTLEPSCRAIVHSGNVEAGSNMEMKLQSFGWDAVRVNLLHDAGWIQWRKAISNVLSSTA